VGLWMVRADQEGQAAGCRQQGEGGRAVKAASEHVASGDLTASPGPCLLSHHTPAGGCGAGCGCHPRGPARRHHDLPGAGHPQDGQEECHRAPPAQRGDPGLHHRWAGGWVGWGVLQRCCCWSCTVCVCLLVRPLGMLSGMLSAPGA
jgi:hypothetical protein